MRIVIIGGHLAPALAVIESLPKEYKVLFIGRKHNFEGDKAESLEYKTITSLKIPFVNLITGRLQRKFSIQTMPSLFKIPYGFVQSFFILNKFKPDAVLGFGGYLSLPVVVSAYLLRIPIVIHEQTLEAGLANKIASFFATKICISWESSGRFFPKEKTVLTGNPIRKIKNQKSKIKNQNESKQPVLYIAGGSSGSHFINTLVEGCIDQLLKNYTIIHQTGDSQQYGDFDRLTNLKNFLPEDFKKRYILRKFIESNELGGVYKNAKLVISRAGANTVTELIYFVKPAILIPIPFSQKNEQLKNGLFLKDLGIGEVLVQEGLSSTKLLQKVKEMLHNIDNYKIKDNNIRKRLENAALKIIETIKHVKKKEKK